MNKNIDLTNLLKDCPQGMPLDCVLFDGEVTFNRIISDAIYPIEIKVGDDCREYLNKYGNYTDRSYGKCVIFPKGKTTWEGFQRPFVDGDIIYVCDEYSDATFTYVAILKQIEKGGEIISHCFYNFEDNYFSTNDFLYDGGHNARFATEKEKEKLFQSIKDNGYEWNSKTKTLEELIVPKFKVGDIIRYAGEDFPIKILDIKNNQYHIECFCDKYNDYKNGIIPVSEQNNYILIPKFNPKTLKPFDKVLVRDFNLQNWMACLFSHIDTNAQNHFKTVDGSGWYHCIPFNDDTKHLVGKKDDAPDFYRYWEE